MAGQGLVVTLGSADGTSCPQPLESLSFPLTLDATEVPSGRDRVAVFLHRPAAQPLQDVLLVASARTVELLVQGARDAAPSYARTLRGAACYVEPGAASIAAVAGDKGGAFQTTIPLQQAYPDWRMLQLRFPASAGSTVVVHRLELAGAGTAAVQEGPSGREGTKEQARGGSVGGGSAGSGQGRTAAQGSMTGGSAQAPEGGDPDQRHAAAGQAGGSSGAGAGGGSNTGPPALTQAQQMRELLLRAATNGSGGGGAAAPGSMHASANLGMAAALARSLLAAAGGGLAGAGAGTGPAAAAPPRPEQPAPTAREGTAAEPTPHLAAAPPPAPAAPAHAGAPAAALGAGGLLHAGLGAGAALPGALAAALGQLADVSARVRRIEAHVLAAAGPGPGQAWGPGLEGGAAPAGSALPAGRVQPAAVPEPSNALGCQQPEEQETQGVLGSGGEHAVSCHVHGGVHGAGVVGPEPTGGAAGERQDPGGSSRPPGAAAELRGSDSAALSAGEAAQLQLAAAVPGLVAAVGRLEGAIVRQESMLQQLSQQVAAINTRLDGVMPHAAQGGE